MGNIHMIHLIIDKFRVKETMNTTYLYPEIEKPTKLSVE